MAKRACGFCGHSERYHKKDRFGRCSLCPHHGYPACPGFVDPEIQPDPKVRLLSIGDQSGRITSLRDELALRIKQRNEDIVKALAEGATERQVGRAANLSGARINQIRQQEAAS